MLYIIFYYIISLVGAHSGNGFEVEQRGPLTMSHPSASTAQVGVGAIVLWAFRFSPSKVRELLGNIGKIEGTSTF